MARSTSGLSSIVTAPPAMADSLCGEMSVLGLPPRTCGFDVVEQRREPPEELLVQGTSRITVERHRVERGDLGIRERGDGHRDACRIARLVPPEVAGAR